MKTKQSIKYLFIFACLTFFPILVFSQQDDSKEKLQQKKVQLEDEIKLANVILREMREDRKESISSLEALNQKLRIREQLIRTINREVELLEKERQQQEFKLRELEDQLNQQQQVYADMIRKIRAQGDNTTIVLFVLSSKDFFQAVKRVQYLKQIANARLEQIRRIEETKENIFSEKEAIERKSMEKKRVIERQKHERKTLNDERKQQELQLTSFRGEEKEIEADIQKKQTQRDQLNKEIQRLIAGEIKRSKDEAKRRSLEEDAKGVGLQRGKDFTAKTSNNVLISLIDKKRKERKAEGADSPESSLPKLTMESQQLTENFSANKKKLPWPVERGLVVTRYGRQNHPVAKQVIIDNKGIDIATQKGSDARAVFDGVVSRIVRIPGANKAVLVSHGNYFTVYSNLTDLYVAKGDQIKVGQSIGRIYTDEETGNTHLHFEVWRDMDVMNPQSWLQ